MNKLLLLFTLLASVSLLNAQAFISELHYDTASTDSGEGVEVYVENPQPDLSMSSIVLYNGNGGGTYGTHTLDGFIATPTPDGVYYHKFISGIQNGAPDGLALIIDNVVEEFLSYEGDFVAVGGPADGMTSTNIGVSESSATAGTSLQREGLGETEWLSSSATSWGMENATFLPVEFLSFTATKRNTQTILAWATASEVNNEKFMIERSVNGQEFYDLGSVAGNGNSTETVEYTFTDYSPVAGINYYRLKQMDFNGDFDYSEIIKIDNRTTGTTNIYPTVVSDYLTIQSEEAAGLKVYNVTGHLLYSAYLYDSTSQVDMTDYHPGTYFVLVTAGGTTTTKQIIKN